MNNHSFLISIRPRFAEQIFAGTKTVELRRVCPRASVGDLALVYVSSPVKELRGGFEVAKIITATPSTLWKKVGNKSGVTKTEFFAYFRGKKQAHALVIKRTWLLPVPLCLTSLRKKKGGFRPPQNFQYLRGSSASLLSNTPSLQNN